jgi:hypothetical protein
MGHARYMNKYKRATPLSIKERYCALMKRAQYQRQAVKDTRPHRPTTRETRLLARFHDYYSPTTEDK